MGFTLIELLVVISILSFLVVMAVTNYSSQLGRGRDAQRKSDLLQAAKFLEEYQNDHQAYPSIASLGGGTSDTYIYLCGNLISGYITKLPCDPINSQEYRYLYEGNGTYYAIHANLENSNDQSIVSVGCEAGCIGANGVVFNYGVASGDHRL